MKSAPGLIAQPPDLRRSRLFQRFRKDQRGVTAIEFGFVAFPFLFMLMMIVETSLVFWTRQVLQEATNQAARTIMTGQSRTLYTGSVAQQTRDFRVAICSRMRTTGAADCLTRLFVDVEPVAEFSTPQANLIQGGEINVGAMSLRQPGPSQIVLVRALYTMPVITPGTRFFGGLSRLDNGRNAIDVTVALRTEPFPASAPSPSPAP